MNYDKRLEEYSLTKQFTKEDIVGFVNGYTNKEVSDEQMTNFLKNIYTDNLSIELIAIMTDAMIKSGQTIDLSEIQGVKVDKHSTGGVGDKVSIIIAPIVSSLGGVVAKMSGRGLGFTGGTLDKLESIPGYNINLSDKQFIDIVKKHNVALMGQTKNIVPADKRIYALRDETNLIDSFPLIASSIMSKKIATGADAILLDVKCGDAAFMKTQKEAEDLARLMIDLGKALGKDVRAEITSMDTPLGYSIGNKNEVLESYRFLLGQKSAKDLEEVIFSSASTLLVQGKVFDSEVEAIPKIKEVLENGKALAKFKEWITSQGGDFEAITKTDFWNSKHKLEVVSTQEGYFRINKAMEFGIAAMKLGAGREHKEDGIDYDAGIELTKKTGDKVVKGDLLFTLYSSNEIDDLIVNYLKSSYEISDTKINKKSILNKL